MEKTANWKSLVSNEEEGQKHVQVTEQDKDLMSKVKTYEPTLKCQTIIWDCITHFTNATWIATQNLVNLFQLDLLWVHKTQIRLWVTKLYISSFNCLASPAIVLHAFVICLCTNGTNTSFHSICLVCLIGSSSAGPDRYLLTESNNLHTEAANDTNWNWFDFYYLQNITIPVKYKYSQYRLSFRQFQFISFWMRHNNKKEN